jgi:cell shape-determining protein MreD
MYHFDCKVIVRHAALFVVCIISSLLNYYVIQVTAPYFPSLTMIPIVLMTLLNREFPITFLVILGVLDDAMCNAPLGLSALIYSAVRIVVRPPKRLQPF